MELYKELLIQLFKEEQIQISFGNGQVNLNKIFESRCYQMLCQIKKVIEDDSLDDATSFMKIEEIVCVFEDAGSSGGSRHDFG